MSSTAPRGGIVDEAALERALQSGKVASAGLDVFSSEPIPDDFPLLKFDNVVMTPHLGASTTEGQDRAGLIVCEQIVAGLTGGVVTYAVNIPSVSKEAMETIGPFLPLAETLGQLMAAVAEGPWSKVAVHYEGALAKRDSIPDSSLWLLREDWSKAGRTEWSISSTHPQSPAIGGWRCPKRGTESPQTTPTSSPWRQRTIRAR